MKRNGLHSLISALDETGDNVTYVSKPNTHEIGGKLDDIKSNTTKVVIINGFLATLLKFVLVILNYNKLNIISYNVTANMMRSSET